MTAEEAQLSGPDFTQGIEAARLADGAMMLGHANGEAVLLARRGAEIFAIGADLHALRRAARRRARRRRHGALPVAPRLLQSAHRRSVCARRR